jgi:hypothetical protein
LYFSAQLAVKPDFCSLQINRKNSITETNVPQYNQNDQIEEDMCGACSTNGGAQKKRDQLEDQDVGGCIILD